VWRDEVAHQRRWPDDSARTVAQAFTEEQPRLLPLPLHPFSTDRMETVCSRKTIYVHFDLNDYSIPPEAVGRPLTLVASDTEVRILDGAAEIARHHRSYDRQKRILDPAHEQALLRTKRKAIHATRAGRSGKRSLAGAGLRRRRIGRQPKCTTAPLAGSVRRSRFAPRHS